MRRLIAATAAGTLAVAASLLGASAASAAGTAEVYVVHGIPGLPVDIYVNGALTLDDFQPELAGSLRPFEDGLLRLVLQDDEYRSVAASGYFLPQQRRSDQR